MVDMSIKVPLDRIGWEVRRWGFGYLITVSEDGRSHVIALVADVLDSQESDGSAVLRFDAGGGLACRNATTSPQVTIVFPPLPHADGFSLVVDGEASVEGDIVDVRPTNGVLHRPAPTLPELTRIDWGDEADYRARASRDGFDEPERRTFAPGPVETLHTHDADVRGLVLSGSFVLHTADGPEVFGPGQGFELAAGTEHSESAEDHSAAVLIAVRS